MRVLVTQNLAALTESTRHLPLQVAVPTTGAVPPCIRGRGWVEQPADPADGRIFERNIK